MWRTLWERHRGAFCFAVGMLCFLVAGLMVRTLPSIRERLITLSPSSSDVSNRAPSSPRDRNEPRVPSPERTPPDTESGGWYLYITGSVRRPGVYRLPPGARTVHLVDAAGGLDGFADPVAVNLAQPLTDGMHVHMPRKGKRPTQESLAILAPTVVRPRTPGFPIDVNRASEADLTALRGIGPTLARRIVAYREANGPFRSVEELAQVKGIGAAKLEGFRDQATVGP